LDCGGNGIVTTTTVSRSVVSCVGTLSVLLALTGCPPDPVILCRNEVVPPQTYEVTLGTTFATPTTCGDLDSLATGSVLAMTVGSTLRQLDCWAIEADVGLPASVDVTGPAPYSIGGNHQTSVGVFLKNVTMSGCSGIMEIAIRETRAADGGTEFVLERAFQTDNAENCPAFTGGTGHHWCGDAWIATVAPPPISDRASRRGQT
jgi:hypothetical protein